MSACQLFSVSACQRVSVSACQRVSVSACQCVSVCRARVSFQLLAPHASLLTLQFAAESRAAPARAPTPTTQTTHSPLHSVTAAQSPPLSATSNEKFSRVKSIEHDLTADINSKLCLFVPQCVTVCGMCHDPSFVTATVRPCGPKAARPGIYIYMDIRGLRLNSTVFSNA